MKQCGRKNQRFHPCQRRLHEAYMYLQMNLLSMIDREELVPLSISTNTYPLLPELINSHQEDYQILIHQVFKCQSMAFLMKKRKRKLIVFKICTMIMKMKFIKSQWKSNEDRINLNLLVHLLVPMIE